jgi:uncharacterized repeat protein (TIGR01451 family)
MVWGPFAQAAGWYDANWPRRQKITIVPTLVDSTLTNFPYMLKISDSANPLFANAQSDGDDILFTDDDGTSKLNHEIELYSNSSNELIAWIKTPVLSSTQNTEIYLYYGNAAVSNQEAITSVWDSDYVMVQHLQETSGTHLDSTAQNNDGTPQGGVIQTATGKVDGADTFDGDNDYVTIPDSTSLQVTSMTLEAWVRIPGEIPSGFHGIVQHAYNTDNWYGLWKDDSDATFHFRWSSGDVRRTDFSTTISPDTWYYVVGVLDPGASKAYCYLNGDLDTSVNSPSLPTPSAGVTLIGAALNTGEWFSGIIDEVRISKTARSQAWIRAAFRNINETDTYQSIGAEVVPDEADPADITDMACGAVTTVSVELSWTAPGDDGNTGTATSYDIRYSTVPITEANWASAVQVSGEPQPLIAGSSQSFTVNGLSSETLYYFAIKAADEGGNESGLSNVPNATTDDSAADLSLALAVSKTDARKDDTITYTITVNNDGPDDATGITVTDGFPSGKFEYKSSSPSKGSYNSSTGEWSLGTLAANTGATLVITVKVLVETKTDPVTTVAEIVAANEFDPDSTPNNSATLPDEDDTDQTTINSDAKAVDLGIVKSDSADPVLPGASITYTLTVTNYGDDKTEVNKGHQVVVVDTLPPNTVFLNTTGSDEDFSCSYDSAAHAVTCTYTENFETGADKAKNILITLSAPTSGGTITNTATVTVVNTDPSEAPAIDNNSDNDTATEETTVLLKISGTIFEDANFAGTAIGYDGGSSDQPLANADVELYDSSNVYIDSATTSTDGSYTFSGLSEGTYKVRVRSASLADADTAPKGGLNATVPGTWPYPLPEMTWGNDTSMYGGQSASVDDTATGDNAGPGDTYVSVSVAGADVTGVNFGFAYNLIVTTADDGLADSALSQQGSLRQFIKNANAIGSAGSTTANTSQFHLSGTSPYTIQPVAALPSISDTSGGTTLDGTSQSGYSGTPIVELDGSLAGTGASGFTFATGDNTLKGFVINSFNDSGVFISGGSGTTIAGNYIGTKASANAQAGNNQQGVKIQNSTGNTIGGTSESARNVISGNRLRGVLIYETSASGNLVLGNYIGTNASGTGALTNQQIGVYLWNSPDNTVGGTEAGAGNVISGNSMFGLYGWGAGCSGNLVQGNTIGLDVTQSVAIANGDSPTHAGVYFSSAVSNIIGGTEAGAANVIAGNTGCGVRIIAATASANAIRGNSIYSNTSLGIDLDSGANNNQAAAVLVSVTPSGTDFIVTGTCASGDTLEIFRANNASSPIVTADPTGSGEGYLYLSTTSALVEGGSNDADPAAGAFSFTIAGSDIAWDDLLTATATAPLGNTSEFSANFTVLEPQPDIILLKTSTTLTDPVNGATNPKAIPGATVLYTLNATNQGTGATDADTVVITEAISANTAVFVGDLGAAGSGPVSFVDNATISGLSYTFTSLASTTDDLEFSNDGGSTYTYVPTADTDGFDSTVTHLRLNLKGTFNAASGGNTPSFLLTFKVRVE